MDNRQLSDDFRDLLVSLNDHEVRYLVVGGYAVGLHGRPRATDDLDIWIDTAPENAGRVLSAIGAFAGTTQGLSQTLLTTPGRIIFIGVAPYRADLFTTIPGVVFEECFDRRVMMELDGVSVPVIDLDRLIASKLAAGRPQDLADVHALQRPGS